RHPGGGALARRPDPGVPGVGAVAPVDGVLRVSPLGRLVRPRLVRRALPPRRLRRGRCRRGALARGPLPGPPAAGAAPPKPGTQVLGETGFLSRSRRADRPWLPRRLRRSRRYRQGTG